MLSSFVALALSMIYLNHSCNAKNLPSISPEMNGLVANSWRPLQNSEYEKDDLLCLSTGCVKAAASIINNMDQSVDPCDDFYQFACGNFIKNTILNDDELSRDLLSVINDALYNQKRMILTEPIQPDELRPFKMMKLQFKSCMDQGKIEKIGLGPMKEILKSLGGWPLLEAENWNESKFEWMDSMYSFKEMGQKMDYLLILTTTKLLKNSTKTAIFLQQPSFGLQRQYLVQGTDFLVVKLYYQYMVDIAVLFGADRKRATEELRESLDFEIELAKISIPQEEETNYMLYKPMNIADLQQKFPSIPWQEFLNKLLNQFIRQDDIIVVSSPKYFSGLEALLKKTPKRVQANYMMQRSVDDAVKYLTRELRQIKYTYRKLVFDNKEVSRWMECVDISFDLFKIALGSMYVRRVSNENTKNNTLEIANDIKKELYKMLLSNEWMDDETREKAMDKAKAMTHIIAYPDELLDDSKLNAYYENLDVNDQDFYTSILNLTKFNTDNEFLKLRKPVNKPDWVTYGELVTIVNAFYNLQDNNFMFTAGFLQGVPISNDLPRYITYSTVGSIIGHEITHGFDNKGRMFDKHGNFANWWVEEINKRFLEKEKCFIKQYGNYTINEDGLKCPLVFGRKDSLVRHEITHTGIRFPCTVCTSTFNYKSCVNRHLKNIHGIVNIRTHLRPIPATPIITQPAPAQQVQIAPQIFVPDVPAGGSNAISDDDDILCMEAMDDFEDNDILCMKAMDAFEDTDSYTVAVNGKRVSTANTTSAANAKKIRLNLVKSPGFVEILSSANRKIVWYYAKNITNTMIYSDFLRPLMPELVNLLKTHVKKHAIKFNLKLEATYNRPNVPNSSENRAFKTSAVELYPHSDIRTIVERAYIKLMKEKDDYSGRGSGFSLESIDGLLLAVYKYTPLGGSSYIELPTYIDRKRGTINPQNTDQECFKWAILARHAANNVSDKYKYCVGENYRKHEDKYNFEGITSPTPLSDINKFENNNKNVSINVYGLEKKFQIPKLPRYEVYPLRVVDEEKPNHFDLLLVTDGENSHYVYISNFSRLVRRQKTKHAERVVFCKRCFTSFDDRRHKYKLSGQEALTQHKLICGEHTPILPEMPKEGDCTEFKAWNKTQRHPIVIYADFETILTKTDEKKGAKTRILHRHEAMSYSLIVKASDNVPQELLEEHGIPTESILYRGNKNKTDVARHFVETVTEMAIKIEKLLKTNKPIVSTDKQRQSHDSCNLCNLCKTNFTFDNHKVADHCHLSGKYRQAICNTCNLKLQTPNFIPIFFHNLSNYDAHLIVTELGHDTKAIKVIPNSEEKFISFTKYVTNTFSMRFIDTFRFMASGLSTLAKNLVTPGLENFRETAKHFVAGDMPLVTQKGVYPYEYTDSWERLDEERLPSKRSFYSTLKETGIKEEDFEHAKLVWNHFGCTTLGEYSDLYLKIDVLLLADVFENFRDVCMRAYNLDAAHYFTAPGLSFDAMLKFTGQKLQLLDDYEMLLMFENGLRGGLVQASKRYAKANNAKTPDYDETKEKSWIVYQDCNNLYGWAMSQYMPYGGFNWVEPTLNGLDDLNDTSPIGRVYEVDVTYPQKLHDKHNDLPFLPNSGIPRGSKVRKLMATFETKKNYVIHYRNLQQAIKNGLKVEKVHRVIQFNQSDWLAKYIELNTELRKKAKNAFEKDFFKLMNNAVFGKTMQSKRKEMKMELVSCERRLQKLINKCTFKHCTNYNENLNAVTLENKIIKFDKPIYIGFAVLDISKTLMYDYHYNVMQKHYGDRIKLMYTDTDSLVYHVQTEDFYVDLAANHSLLDRMDTANLPIDHPCYVAERKKTPGFFSDDVDGDIITEFCALRAKSYAYNIYAVEGRVGGGENIKAKGIRAHVVKNHMTLEDHRKCLFGEVGLELNRDNVSIRSFNHQLMTIKTRKLTYNSYDDKRVVLEDKINTLAHGHYSIEEDD